MSLLGIDLGGTKLGIAVFTTAGKLVHKENIPIAGRKGKEVGSLISENISTILHSEQFKNNPIRSIGISVPGISRTNKGTVWAPNIPGWDDYPLLAEVQTITNEVPVKIESDRACYILGENWQGNARGCKDAIFLAVGTGIGAGIMVDGKILRGSHDISGAIGWMALQHPFNAQYASCGCFEYYASGSGIATLAQNILKGDRSYDGQLKSKPVEEVSSHEVFEALQKNDPVASQVISICIQYWGMAVANLVSLFNPEKIILGGGVFGPAIRFIPAIMSEALKWAQPISIHQVSLEASLLGSEAGVYGAGYIALQTIHPADQMR